MYMAAHRADTESSDSGPATPASETLESETLESETLESETLESDTLESDTLESDTLESETLSRGSTVTYDSADDTDDTADSIRGITPPRVVVTRDDSESESLEISDESETYHLDPEMVSKERYSSTRRKVETKKTTIVSKKRTAVKPLDRPGPSVYPRVHIPVSIISVVVMNHHTTVHVYGDAVSIAATHRQWHDTTVHASDIPAPLADLYILIPKLWRYAPRRVRLGKNADTVPLAVWPGPDRQGDHPHALKSCYTLYVVM